MNKQIALKIILGGSIVALCAGVLVFFLLWEKEEPPAFIPDEPTPLGGYVESWTENKRPDLPGVDGVDSAGDDGGGGAVEGGWASGAQPTKEPEAYPMVVRESETETVIEFNDPAPPKPLPPEEPPSQDAQVAESANGETTEESGSTAAKQDNSQGQSLGTGGNKQEPAAPGTPVPGSKNDKGQVYDIVFGWVTPSKTITEPITSDGDPNKMVGTMD